MTQEEALAEFKKLRPDTADNLQAEHVHIIGCKFGSADEYKLWDVSDHARLVLFSSDSWEDVLAKAKDGAQA
jgi:hypothetical protein